MIPLVFPVRASGQRIHARTMIPFVLPMRASGQSIHARTKTPLVLPVRESSRSLLTWQVRSGASANHSRRQAREGWGLLRSNFGCKGVRGVAWTSAVSRLRTKPKPIHSARSCHFGTFDATHSCLAHVAPVLRVLAESTGLEKTSSLASKLWVVKVHKRSTWKRSSLTMSTMPKVLRLPRKIDFSLNSFCVGVRRNARLERLGVWGLGFGG